MSKIRSISSDAAPVAIGPYSQAVEVDIADAKLLFLSGQIAINPATGELVGEGLEEQVRQVMENLSAVLRQAESSFARVVKTTIFLVDMKDFPACNAVYAQYFEGPPPARATVAVQRLPKDARVEIELVAIG